MDYRVKIYHKIHGAAQCLPDQLGEFVALGWSQSVSAADQSEIETAKIEKPAKRGRPPIVEPGK